MLCCHTTNGLPHIFTTVFATEDPLDRVSAFYTDGPAPSASPASRPSLSFRPATAAPPGCVPGAADRSLVVVSEMPPFPH